jgi:SAM-dependent methyltransferase
MFRSFVSRFHSMQSRPGGLSGFLLSRYAKLTRSMITKHSNSTNMNNSNITKTLPGVLLRSPTSEFGDKVFYVDRGCRHWVRDGEWLKRNGFNWFTDVIDVKPEILYCFLNRGIAPIHDRSDLGKPNLSSLDVREIAASRLYGTGVEFGAGASPFPLPIDCNVRFADAFSYESLKAVMYPGQKAHDLIRPDYVTDIKTLAGIPDASLDFIVACHVIEHTNNPIAAIDSCYRALKTGGSLVLVVPDMTKTFDSKREPTTLDHLIEDYEMPSYERDREHYEEFYTKAFKIPSEADIFDYAAQKQTECGDLHYHTWTFESFEKLIDWHVRKTGWAVDFTHPTLPGEGNIEFYFVLTK